LNASALPVPINLVNHSCWPKLGQNQFSMYARRTYRIYVVALFVVTIVCQVDVRIALAVYSVLVLAMFKIMHVTLTLSGLAGFVLSIGMQ